MASFCELCNATAPDDEALCASCAASASDRATLDGVRRRIDAARKVAAEYARARVLVRRAQDYRAEGAQADDPRVVACLAELALAREEVKKLRANGVALGVRTNTESFAALGVRKAVPRAPISVPGGNDKSGFGVG